MKIQVLVDVYRNYFPQKYSGNVVYDNVRAINLAEQSLVDQCIVEMKNEELLVILDREMILPKNELYPLEVDKKATLNVEKKCFEF